MNVFELIPSKVFKHTCACVFSIFFFIEVNSQTYCVSQASQTNDEDAYIENVSFNDLNSTNTTCPATYTDNTTSSASVVQNEKYDLTVILSSCGGLVQQTVRIYIDWNDDGDFDDPFEEVGASSGINGNGVYTTSVFVPPVLSGNSQVRMRVVTVEGATHPGSCGEYENGETEDYTIDVEYVSQIKEGEGDNRATDIGGGCFQLTPNLGYTRGAAWFIDPLDLNDAFDIRVELNFGINYAWPGGTGVYPEEGGGADGIAFVLQQEGLNAGSVGGGIGYENLDQSLAVEFDPYYNFAQDPIWDHIGIAVDGDVDLTCYEDPGYYWAGRVCDENSAGQINDRGGRNITDLLVPMMGTDPTVNEIQTGTNFETRFTWDPVTQRFEVWFNCELKIALEEDFVNTIFNGGSQVFYGFTSATGSEFNEHTVCTKFNSVNNSISDVTICEGQSAGLNAYLAGIDLDVATFTWTAVSGDDISSLDNPNIANPIATPDSTTVYAVEIDMNDCYDSPPILDTLTVYVEPNTLQIFDLNIEVCPSDPQFNLYDLILPHPPSTGNWVGPATITNGFLGTIDPSIAPTGAYTYRIGTDCEGFQYNVNLTNPPLPSVTVSQGGQICNDGSETTTVQFDISGDSPWNLSYSIDGVTQPTITDITTTPYILNTATPGIYEATRISTAGCAGITDTTTALVERYDNITVSNIITNCSNDNLTYTVSFDVEGGDETSYTMTSINGVTGTVSPTAPYIFTSDPVVEGTNYHININDANDCNPIDITGFQSCLCPATATIIGGGIICHGEEIPQVRIEMSGTPPWDITYTIDGVDQPALTGITTSPYFLTPPDSLSHTYTISDFSDAVCLGSFSGQAQVVINPQPNLVITDPAPICGPVDLTAPSITMETQDINTFALSYYTNQTDAENNLNSIPDDVVTKSGTYYIKASTNTSPSCIDIQPVIVITNPQPTLIINTPGEICEPATVDLTLPEITIGSTGGGELAYYSSLTDAENGTNSIDATAINTSGTYYIKAETNTTPVCLDIQPVDIIISPPPSLVVTDPEPVCSPNIVDITTSTITTGSQNLGVLTYYATDVDAILNQNHLSSPDAIDQSGIYYIKTTIGTPPAVCEQLEAVNVIIYPKPPSPSVPSVSVCERQDTVLSVADFGDMYDWHDHPTLESIIANNTLDYYTSILTGTETYYIEATNSFGCVSEHRTPVTVYVNPLPLVSFNVNDICENDGAFFENTSFAQGNNVSYDWDFGDPNSTSNTSNQITPTHTYTQSGDYDISLEVTTDFGCQHQAYKTITVYGVPLADFTADSVCIGLTNTLSGINDPNSNIVDWYWTFGDGDTGGGKDQTHLFPTDGSHYVSLTVFTDVGCTNSNRKAVIVHPEPVASYSVNPQPTDVLHPEVTFKDLSSGSVATSLAEGGWDFGNGFVSDYVPGENISQIYPDDNIAPYAEYPTQLTVVNEFGCIDTATYPVRILPVWTYFVPNSFTPDNNGVNDEFKGKGFGIEKAEMWIFNRWGDNIFHTDDKDEAWDGKDHMYQGGAEITSDDFVKVDTYVYRIEIINIFGEKHKFIGEVNLIR